MLLCMLHAIHIPRPVFITTDTQGPSHYDKHTNPCTAMQCYSQCILYTQICRLADLPTTQNIHEECFTSAARVCTPKWKCTSTLHHEILLTALQCCGTCSAPALTQSEEKQMCMSATTRIVCDTASVTVPCSPQHQKLTKSSVPPVTQHRSSPLLIDPPPICSPACLHLLFCRITL